jgi:hypothetical protein
VLGRGGQHLLQQLAVAGLELGLILQPAARGADPGRKRVADGLELAEVQRPRLPRESTDAGLDLHTREGVSEE